MAECHTSLLRSAIGVSECTIVHSLGLHPRTPDHPLGSYTLVPYTTQQAWLKTLALYAGFVRLDTTSRTSISSPHLACHPTSYVCVRPVRLAMGVNTVIKSRVFERMLRSCQILTQRILDAPSASQRAFPYACRKPRRWLHACTCAGWRIWIATAKVSKRDALYVYEHFLAKALHSAGCNPAESGQNHYI